MCLILSTIYIFIHVSVCGGRGLHALLCPGAYNAVKTALDLVDISFSIVDRTFAYIMREVPRSNPIGDVTFFGDKICSTVTQNYKQNCTVSHTSTLTTG